MKKTISTADLATKTCKRGHTGQYYLRKDGSSACKGCTRLSVARYRGVDEAKVQKLREDSAERLSELETRITKLRLELELSEAEYEFHTKKLALISKVK